MKKLITSLALLVLCGCTSTNITKLVGALAKDPAAVRIEVVTAGATVKLYRVSPSTNILNYSVSPDGIVIGTKP